MPQRHDRTPPNDALAFLSGGGEMGELIRAFDWSRTPLGPIASWPGSLRTTVSICLASDLPICIIWGPGLVQIYNDGYRLICGNKHPRSLGQNFSDCWIEAWPVIGEAHDSALAGDTAFLETERIFLDRHGYTEECFFTFSFSPIRDEAGHVSGLFHPVIEMTAKMLGERRTQTLRDVGAQTVDATTAEEACERAARALVGHDRDIPFALLYLLDEIAGGPARLAACVGMPPDTVASPRLVELGPDASHSWPLAEVARTGQTLEIDDLEQRFGHLSCGPDADRPRVALAQALRPPGAERPVGVLVTGISSRLKLTQPYRDFHELLAAAVTAALANGRASEEERRRAEALAELDRTKTAFFSNVSHEFRTPLTLMLGPVEEMLARSQTELPPAATAQLEVVSRNGLRLLRLVNALLDFSRIEAGRVRAVFQPTDLSAFTSELASVFRSACERAGLSLTVDCPPLHEPVFVDRDMWEKIVLNLLSNAFKFTFKGGISVALSRVGSSVLLQVKDTGTGIAAQEIPRLFERFYRVENARGRTHEGSGIGLSLVQELIKLHGGSIAAESMLGVGTTFTAMLPLGAAHLPADQISEGRGPASTGTGAMPYVEEALQWLPDLIEPRSELPTYREALPVPYVGYDSEQDDRPRVLVADDNADMRHYIVRLLAEHFHTEAVPDGEAALSSARDRLPDLILTDVMMPRLDGFGLLRALRADPATSNVPVIMLSARAGEGSRVEGMQAGADDYLVKPFSARELLARVTAHLQMARMRREASESLRQGEERLRMALTAARMVAWQIDVATGSMVLSDNAAEVFGRTTGTMPAQREHGFGLLHPDDLDSHVAKVNRAIAECGSYVSQFRMQRQDNGAFMWLEDRGHGVGDGPGHTVRLVGVVMDISDRKLAEAEIRNREQQTRTILESITDGFFALDREWRFSYVNPAAEAFLDRTAGELIGQRLWDEFPGALGSEFERVYRRVASNLVAESFTAHYPDLERWYEVHAYPAPDGLSVYFRDVTLLKRTEEQLRASEERRRLALNDAELGAWNLNPATGATRTDVRFQAIFGATEEWTDYRQIVAVIHPDDQPAVRAAVAMATQLVDPVPCEIEFRILHRDGALRWVFAKGRSSFEGVGAARRVVSFDGTVADISDRKRAEHEREYLFGELRDHDRRKDEFLATLAHELRSPLAPIRNGLEIIRLVGSTDSVEQTRQMMDRQLDQMVRLVDDLLDVSRITRGKLELRRARVELAAVITIAMETAGPLIEQAGHTFDVQLPGEPLFVDGDVARLSQVVSNLLSNSAKYTPRGGRIRLVVEHTDAMVTLSVQDNGIGIPDHLMDRVFEMFTQGDRTLEKTAGGLGIGLSLAKGLIEMHGGTIEARSEGDARGSEFVIRLPLLRFEARAEAPPVEVTSDVAPVRPRRVLVADDNQDAADSLAALLQLRGHLVRTANDGVSAIEEAEAFRPDIVLLDIAMPRLNGYDVCQRIRAQSWGAGIVLVAMTGWGQEEDKRRSFAAGFNDHLVKPVDSRLLHELIAAAPTAPTAPVRPPS